jgi:cell wall assembly regulator SMI1
MHSIPTSWDKIVRWFDTNPPPVPDDALELYGGATAKEIKEAEKVMGLSLPEDVKESYRLHNGNRECQGLFTWGGGLFSLKGMVKQWQMWAKHLASGIFKGAEDPPQLNGPIKKYWWNLKWVPIIDRGGSCDFIDMDPAKGGHVGQIVHFFRETGPDRVQAPSWQAYLSDFADGLEEGKLCYDDDWAVVPREKKRKRK